MNPTGGRKRRALPAVLTASLVCAFAAWALAQPRLRGAAPSAASTSRCARFSVPDAEGAYLSYQDRHPPTPLVDGNDLLALVNRSPRWSLGPDYAPSDMVDVNTLQPLRADQCRPPEHHCLRREAARALRNLYASMRRAGHEPFLDSAWRGFALQCGVFAKWAYGHHHGFCRATEFSALPGHSQHQLGTTVDLFSRAWTNAGNAFRPRFGCSPGGRWIAEHSWEFGFVLPYPLHPDYREPGSDCIERPDAVGRVDPRTGYKYEPWHLRYIGVESARTFHAAWLASGPGTEAELTLEQWLRARLGEVDPLEPPVCDGCTCGACSTFARVADAPPRPAPVPLDAGRDASRDASRDSTADGPPADAPSLQQVVNLVADAGSSALSPCGRNALWLDEQGHPVPAAGPPTLREVRLSRAADGALEVTARVSVPPQTLTQPPVLNARAALRYHAGESVAGLAVVTGGVAHRYPALPSAWRLAVARSDEAVPSWQAALVDDARDPVSNGANSRLPATAGELTVQLRVEGIAPGTFLRVGLAHDAARAEERTFHAP